MNVCYKFDTGKYCILINNSIIIRRLCRIIGIHLKLINIFIVQTYITRLQLFELHSTIKQASKMYISKDLCIQNITIDNCKLHQFISYNKKCSICIFSWTLIMEILDRKIRTRIATLSKCFPNLSKRSVIAESSTAFACQIQQSYNR